MDARHVHSHETNFARARSRMSHVTLPGSGPSTRR